MFLFQSKPFSPVSTSVGTCAPLPVLLSRHSLLLLCWVIYWLTPTAGWETRRPSTTCVIHEHTYTNEAHWNVYICIYIYSLPSIGWKPLNTAPVTGEKKKHLNVSDVGPTLRAYLGLQVSEVCVCRVARGGSLPDWRTGEVMLLCVGDRGRFCCWVRGRGEAKSQMWTRGVSPFVRRNEGVLLSCSSPTVVWKS